MSTAARNVVPDPRKQLASMPIAVLLLGPHMRIAGANPAAEQFFGQSARRLSRMTLMDLLSFNDSRMMARLSDIETPISAREIEIILIGRGSRRVDITAAPIADTPGWQLLSLHDNSTFDALGDDAGSGDDAILRGPEILAHEIKNPLAAIRGASQLLARKAEPKDRALTDLITAEVDRIAGLIEQMQLLSGKTIPPLVPCNLHEIIRRAIAVLTTGSTATGKWFAIKEEFDPSLPPVLGDADGLVQVLINLLVNAQEACGTGPDPQIMVRTRFASGLQLHSTDSGKLVRLSVEIRVSDNGPGIPPSIREHLFEPFVTTKKSGHGLGLPLVRKLVRDMNGRISHERDDSLGLTHFRIHLPLAPEQRHGMREDEVMA